MLLSVVITAIE